MTSGGGAQSPPGAGSSSGAASFNPSAVNTASQTGAGGTGKTKLHFLLLFILKKEYKHF